MSAPPDHSSQKIAFDGKGRLRLIEQESHEIEFKEIDLAAENNRVKKVTIQKPDGTSEPGIFLPQKISTAVIAAAGFEGISTAAPQPGTGTGRYGAPSTGGQTPRNVLEEMRARYPEYFRRNAIPNLNIREAIDPYSFSVRNQFINAARDDPTLAPALRKRKNAFFRNGFTLELEKKDNRSPTTHKVMTDEQLETFHAEIYAKYNKVLRQLDAWIIKSSIGLLKQMKKAYYSGIVQGRYLTKFFPPLQYLEPGQLPMFLDTMSIEELHNVVIDRFTKQIVACRIASLDNDRYLLLPDEFVYGYINDDTMTKYEVLYGRSDLEPVIQASRTNKFIIAEAYPKAAIAAYMPKVVGQIPVQGNAEEKEEILKRQSAALADPELNVLLVESAQYTELQALPQTVNQDVIRDIRKDIDEIMIGAVGSTKAQISRTENLTRDNATIQEIENERNVITPDELMHAEFFETQLLNPLFAHLNGVPEEYLDVKVVIRRIPDKEDILEKFNKGEGKNEEGQSKGGGGRWGRQQNLAKEKKEDIAAGALQQQDAKTALGASGTAVLAEASGDYISWFTHLPKKHQIRWRQYDSVLYKMIDHDLDISKNVYSFDEHKDDDDVKWIKFMGTMLDKLTELGSPKEKKVENKDPLPTPPITTPTTPKKDAKPKVPDTKQTKENKHIKSKTGEQK